VRGRSVVSRTPISARKNSSIVDSEIGNGHADRESTMRRLARLAYMHTCQVYGQGTFR
jgi:hypothetical protein